MTVTFHVLGPLEVRAAGRPVRISGRKPRLLLATLLLDAGQVVGADQLVEVLWPEHPPRSAQANLRTYVSSLRADLAGADSVCADVAGAEAAATEGQPAGLLRGDGSGYAIHPAEGALDLLAFEELVGQGRFAEALALWRGSPLADLPGSPVWERRLEPLHEMRLRVAEELIGRRMDGGDHAGAVTELRGLLAEHPYREDLWSRLVTALHRGGRKAEALRAYATIRQQLVDELGVEPGAGLRAAYEAILGDDTPAVTPRQLPPDLPDFTGRRFDLTTLAKPFQVAVVSGPPGVGKSALAVHAGHALRDRFPEGQLYLDLDGREPADVLAEALRALGVDAPPPTLRERSALFRSMLAERPMFVLLDDALDAAQVRPLLPGNGSSVVVTSRRRVTQLPGALQIQLGELPAADAMQLLSRIIGADRVAREQEDALAIVEACGRLPLALRAAGSRLAARPGWSLAVLRQRLEDDRLTELAEVRESLERSYLHLTDEAIRTLGTFGRLGGLAQPAWVVDAALGRHRADDVTDLLVDVNLLELVGTDPVGQPRYRAPDLIRRHALDRVPDRAPDRDGLARVLAAWTATTEHAMAKLPTTVFTLTAPRTPRWPLPGKTLDRLTADPLSWFKTEHDSLVGAVTVAAEAGLAESAWGLAAAMVPYLDLHCLLDTWQRTHGLALEAARAAGDRYGEAAMLRGLAQVALYQDRYDESAEGFTRSRELFHDLGDVRAEATSICGLGAVSQFRGRHAQSLARFKRALAMFLSAADPQGEAFARQAIGRVCLKAGDYAQADASLSQAMRLAQELGDSHREGCVSLQMGQLHRAVSYHRHALDIFESLGDRHCGAYARQSLAGLQVARGEFAGASAGLERSLLVFQELGDRSGEASATQLLGELHRAAGRTGLALDYLNHAGVLRRGLPA